MNARLSPRLRPLVQALSLGVGVLALPVSAQALTISTTYAFTNSGSVTDTSADGEPETGTLLGSTDINQFDASSGVLTGTTLGLTSTRTEALSGEGITRTSKTNSASGTGVSSNTSITIGGTTTNFANFKQAVIGSCSATGKAAGCSYPPPATNTQSLTTNLAPLPGGSLDSYVGTGTVLATRSADLSVSTTNTAFTSTTATLQLDWSGKLTVSYDYLLHAAPSFNGSSTQLTLNLDFGTFTVDDSANPLAFSIFNLLGDRVGLDLDSISGSGHTSALTTNLLAFFGLDALDAGSSNGYLAFLDTASAGNFAATYLLSLSDADVGAGLNNYFLTLNLTGKVVDPTAVPEPATLTLLGLGLLGLGWRQRRSR